MVVLGDDLADTLAEADVLGPRGAGCQEHLRCRGMRVLLEEMVLYLPGEVDTQPISNLHLLEGFVEEALLGAIVPGPG